MTTFALTAHDWDQAKGPCCGVLACAIAAQKPFKDAWPGSKKPTSTMQNLDGKAVLTLMTIQNGLIMLALNSNTFCQVR